MAAVLVAAVAHAAWNAIAKGIGDQLVAFSLICLADLVCGLAVAAVAPAPAPASWPFLGASAVVHLGYQLLLMRSFRLGDFGQVYPIARGTAPLVVTVLALVFLGELPSLGQTAGVLLACAGLAGVALWGVRGPGGAPRAPAVTAALGTGLCIAGYTVIDGAGVRESGSVWGYTGWLIALQGIGVPLIALALRGPRLFAQLRPAVWLGLCGGALSTLAYGLVLWAQSRAPLAPVAALRESSVIVGAAIGAVFFRERFGGPRIAAAVLLTAGIALMLSGG